MAQTSSPPAARPNLPAPVAPHEAASGRSAPALAAVPVPAPEAAIEDLIALRAGALLARLGDEVPALHAPVMEQAERGLFRAVLAHTGNHLGRTARILGLDRNTCARKARAFGLVDEPTRGRKPREGRDADDSPTKAGRTPARKKTR